MAIACLRLLTLAPLPDLSSPRLCSRITFATFFLPFDAAFLAIKLKPFHLLEFQGSYPVSRAASLPSCNRSAEDIVGRTPSSAADPMVGLLVARPVGRGRPTRTRGPPHNVFSG